MCIAKYFTTFCAYYGGFICYRIFLILWSRLNSIIYSIYNFEIEILDICGRRIVF